MRYGVPNGFWPDTKFGRNLVAYIIYQVIELAVPQLTIKHSLNKIFGFKLLQCRCLGSKPGAFCRFL